MEIVRTLVVVTGAFAVVACTSTITGDPGPDDGDEERDAAASSSSSSGSSSSGSSGSYETDAGAQATRPPPVITDVSPLAGDYGTVVTITGDNLDEASAALSLATPTEPLEVRMPAPSGTTTTVSAKAIVVKWSKTEIQFKYPFPAEGAIGITTRSGQAQGGAFEPSWRPGSPLAGVFSRRELLAAVSPSAGRLVAAFDGATGPLIVIAEPDGTVKSKPFQRGGTLLFQASLYVTAAGTVDGLFVANGTLWTLTDAAGAATTASTGVSATRAAGGRDATGPYAWVSTGASTLTRLRPPAWTSTGETVTDPTTAGAPGRSLAVGPDHSLYAGWGVNSKGSFPTYDHTSRPVVRRLRPGQSTFDAQRNVGGGADDYMAWTRFLGGPGGRVASYYCANDSGAFASTSWDCGEGYVGDIAAPSSTLITDYVLGWNETTTFATMCEKATGALKVGPEGQTAQQQNVLFPCPHVAAAAVDPAAAGVFVAWSGKYLYAPKKR